MNRKGFTLIELLVTVALLAIISMISFVSINNAINEGKKKDCKSLVGSIKSATKEYVSDNRYGALNIANFNAKVLIDNNYLSGPIYDPFDKNTKIDASKVTITITLNKDETVKDITIGGTTVLTDCMPK